MQPAVPATQSTACGDIVLALPLAVRDRTLARGVPSVSVRVLTASGASWRRVIISLEIRPKHWRLEPMWILLVVASLALAAARPLAAQFPPDVAIGTRVR